MASVYDVDANLLIVKAAESLKKIPEMKPPTFTLFCKTGTHKERPPTDPDWFYMRSASILRKVHMKGPVGVAKLRTVYGGRKNMGVQPERFKKGSGSVIRKAFQLLEKSGLVKQAEKGNHKGRVITPKGNSLLDKAATEVQKIPKKEEYKPIGVIPKPEAPKPAVKVGDTRAVKKPEVAKPAPKTKSVENKSESKDSDNAKQASQKVEAKPVDEKKEAPKPAEKKEEAKPVEKKEEAPKKEKAKPTEEAKVEEKKE